MHEHPDYGVRLPIFPFDSAFTYVTPEPQGPTVFDRCGLTFRGRDDPKPVDPTNAPDLITGRCRGKRGVQELRHVSDVESMMATKQELESAIDNFRESGQNTEFTGEAAKAYDEGRAMAMQGYSNRSCPYLRDAEHELFEAWQQGFSSYANESL